MTPTGRILPDFYIEPDFLLWQHDFKPAVKHLAKCGLLPSASSGSIPSPTEAVSLDGIDWYIRRFFIPNLSRIYFDINPETQFIRHQLRALDDSYGETRISSLLRAWLRKSIKISAQEGGNFTPNHKLSGKWDAFAGWKLKDAREEIRQSPIESYAKDARCALLWELVLVVNAFDRWRNYPKQPYPQLKDIPEFKPFLAADERTRLSWELLDLNILDYAIVNPPRSRPIWNTFVDKEPQVPFGITGLRYNKIITLLSKNGINTRPFFTASLFTGQPPAGEWSRLHSVPILTYDFYLRCFHPQLHRSLSREAARILSEFCRQKNPTMRIRYVLERMVSGDIACYSTLLTHMVENARQFFPQKVRRGRRPQAKGYQDEIVAKYHDLVTDDIVRIARKKSSRSAFVIHEAYAHQKPKINRLSVTASIASALFGYPVTAEAVKSSLRRIKNAAQAGKA